MKTIDIAEFSFTDAPFMVPTFGKSKKYSWWSDIKRSNDKQTVEYVGLYDSILKIAQEEKQRGPFDVLLGHSQGAALVIAMAALSNNPKLLCQLASSSGKKYSFPIDMLEMPKPALSIILSGFLPRDYVFDELFTNGSILTTPPRTLHIYANNDDILPPIASIEAIRIFKSPIVHITSNGHDPPRDDVTITNIGRFLESLYREKACRSQN